MKNYTMAFAIITALTLGALGTAQARDHGVQNKRHATMQHRASPRKFQRFVDRRQANQRTRIKRGWRSGNLDRKEVARLHGNQRRIGKMERHFGADGRYSRDERRIIKHKLDRSSQRIWRMKGKHYRPKPGYGKHGAFYSGYRWPRIHYPRVHGVYPVYLPVYGPTYGDAPSHSLGFYIETEEFRFSVDTSG